MEIGPRIERVGVPAHLGPDADRTLARLILCELIAEKQSPD
jgi:hypothetical protein